MEKVCFVILHYIVINDTIECVESILNNIKYNNYHIIIIDNNSPDSSGNILKNKYEKNDFITVIINNKNLGFAKGNNIGYKYATERLKANFVILINNDTIIKQSEFIDKIINDYNEVRYYVLGPNIISVRNNLSQNPQRLKGLEKNEVKKLITTLKYMYFRQIINDIVKKYINYKIINIMKSINKRISKSSIKENNNKLNNDLNHSLKQENVQLHGSCLIFSPLYIDMFHYGLYPETFMYMEEDILYYICKQNNLKTFYDPDIIIYHKEDASTDAVQNSNSEKRKFYLQNLIKSAKILYKLMND